MTEKKKFSCDCRSEHPAAPATNVRRAFFIILCLLISGCTGEERLSPESTVSVEDLPDQIFDGFELALTDNGVRKGWVTAAEASKYTERKIFIARQLKVIFYTPTGQVNSILTSRRGIIHTDTNNMEAMDSVIVYSADSSRILRTERLEWKKNENLIVSDTTVMIQTAEGVVHGDGIVTDAGFKEVEVKNPTGDINVLRR